MCRGIKVLYWRVGVFDLIKDMLENKIPIFIKTSWENIVLERDSQLEDRFWSNSKLLHKDKVIQYLS